MWKLLRQPGLEDVRSLDDPARTVLHGRVIREKPFLRRIHLGFYREFLRASAGLPPDALLVELGSGGGFIKDVIPSALTSDILAVPGVDKRFSCLEMPFEAGSVGAFFMIDVFHHVPDAAGFLREMDRCLRPGGCVVMIEPAATPWARFIYRRFHHEPFETTGGWRFESAGPLSSANGALPWIVFERDRERFQREFPRLRLVGIRKHTPFRYILSGGLTLRQLAPSFTYPLVRGLEWAASPLSGLLGMFQTIRLEKQGPV
jgi:SAM-dependent methyltransferase